MVLKKLILDNFLTFKHLDYEFEKKAVLVQGLNLTDDKQKSNGVGKSGVQTGIEFCITSSNSRDVRDNELVTFGEKEARAQLIAECSTRKETIHIDWTIRVSGSNKLTLTKKIGNQEWEEVSFSNVNDGKKYILAWFAISKEDLFNYYIINNSRFKSFFKSSNKENVDLINRFSDASIIEGLEDIDKAELELSLNNKEQEKSRTLGKLELLNEELKTELARDFKDELESRKVDFRNKITQKDLKIAELDNKILEAEEEKESLEKEIKEFEKEGEQIQVNITRVKGDVEKVDKTFGEVSKELEKANEAIAEFEKTDWNQARETHEKELQDETNLLEEAANRLEKQNESKSKISKLLEGIEIKLSGAITCPSCSHVFLLEGDITEMNSKKLQALELKEKFESASDLIQKSIDKSKETVREIEAKVSKINTKEQSENEKLNQLSVNTTQISAKINELEKQRNSLKKDLNNFEEDYKDSLRDIKDAESEIKSSDDSIDLYKESISEQKDSIKSLKEEMKNLSLGENKETLKKLRSNIAQLGKDKERTEIEIAKIGDQIYLKNQWITNFKQFRMFLANQSLEAIEFHINRFLFEMSSDLRVKIDGFKYLADGSIREQITPRVIREGERTFNSFSGGERGRLLFASILANRHMINESHPYGGLDFLSIDEVFEGIDGLGLSHLIKAAKQLDISVMVVTHVTDEDVADDKLLVIKEGGFSRIEKN